MTFNSLAARALGVAALALGLAASPALAAGESVGVIDHDFAHEGMFGSFDSAQLRRGWEVYAQNCASCHGMKQLSYRNLGDPNGPDFAEEDVKAIAEQFQVPALDEFGDPTTRAATPQDHFVSPYPNEAAAKVANGGALPPDLSLITKARSGYHGIVKQFREGAGGPEYVYSVLLGYSDNPPEGFDVGALYYNRYFPGHKIAMPPPLYDGFEYLDGTEGTVAQQAEDVTAFLTWAAEPKMVERKEAGLRNILFLTLFAVLVWYSNKKLWAPVKKNGH